ncbi:mariner-Tc1 transposon family protein [Coccidioides posadasii C735 delta SOWgp]|nr:mariner-Tc1 transposon family protein [Coccidioides posadasii C735 delta SOWgp]EER28895.1 mariner-Tc1 transposon family protein [Coccidioides posadasii C735 delta SOWgp]KMM63714.1 hypothetical protein CPAG_00068 [Coccidioides posadasii RMSCC 3488]|eukprot:XP_003071040.1 mariner-Tc1 transposon family protein [Coccidioides posadasii C735 delta SOWgp]
MVSTYKLEEELIRKASEEYSQRTCANEKVSVATLAREYKVSYHRLRRRILNVPSRSTRKRTNLRLTEEQYKALYEYLELLGKEGTSVTPQMLRDTANSILRESHTDPNTPPPTVGKGWQYRFIEMHPHYFPNIKVRKNESRLGPLRDSLTSQVDQTT